MSSDARRRLVAGAADMIRRRGLSATSVRDVAAHSGAPLGSTYHYFPGGKQQLAEEAVRLAGQHLQRVIDEEFAAGPVAGVGALFAVWREVVVRTDFRAGCPVLAVVVEGAPPGDDPPLALNAADEVFRGWRAQLAASLREHGVHPARAVRLAAVIVASAEGTVVMCRAQRSTQPLDDIAVELVNLVRAAVS